MADWQPIAKATDYAADNGGVILLWHSANIQEKSDWRTTGVFGVDIFAYFFIPAGFTHTGENEFTYNFPLEYVNESVKVTGYVTHDGIRQLHEGKTEPFWHLKETPSEKVLLQTDSYLKIPYLLVPARGLPSPNLEARFFQPLPELL